MSIPRIESASRGVLGRILAKIIGTGFLTFGGNITADRVKTFQNTTATLAELETAQTFTAAQTINVASGTIQTWQIASVTLAIIDGSGNFGVGVTPTSSNGLLQLASGTTKASGIAYGDTFQFRYSSGGLDTTGPAATDIVNRVTRSTGEACIFAVISGSGYIGSQSNHPLNIITNNAGRLVISANGLTCGFFDGMSFVFGTTTGTQLASAANQKMGFWGATPIVQQAGYGTPTGAALLTNFPGATATLAQTSGALADLLLKLKTAGLIGA